MPEQVDSQTKNVIIQLRVKEGKTMREISKETGISLGKVAEICKGVKPSEDKDPIEEKEKTEFRGPTQFIPQLISRELQAKLYALGLNEDYDDVNKYITEILLPWLAVKRDFEWKLRTTIKPKEFGLYIEQCMIDSVELKELKAKLGNLGEHPTKPVQVNSLTVKAS